MQQDKKDTTKACVKNPSDRSQGPSFVQTLLTVPQVFVEKNSFWIIFLKLFFDFCE